MTAVIIAAAITLGYGAYAATNAMFAVTASRSGRRSIAATPVSTGTAVITVWLVFHPVLTLA